jgi:hypothetical protein
LESLKWLFGGLLLIGSVVVALLVAWHLRSGPTTPTARELALRFEAVSSMSGAQFEVFTADLFTALGHQAVVLGGAGDQGVDVIVNRRGERVAVQCKNHNKPWVTGLFRKSLLELGIIGAWRPVSWPLAATP